METRRQFLQKAITIMGSLAFGQKARAQKFSVKRNSDSTSCDLYRAINGSPAENLSKVIELMGGIERIVGPDDVVIIKPNVQGWNQGASNLSAFMSFVDLVMNHSRGFRGEVVLAENCHRGDAPWEHAGWAHEFLRNSDIDGIKNYNDLTRKIKEKYGNRFSVCHWNDVDSGGKRIFKPSEGVGYVYCDGTGGIPLVSFNNGLRGNEYREVIMTYPIFQTDAGTVIDLKNGVWERNEYTDRPLCFINFAALNHHSTYCGVTSAIKNYLGVSDLSGGSDPHNGGKLTEKYYNFHSFPFNKWAPGPKPGMIGGEIGVFMNTIRKADLNITTAEWVGLVSPRAELPGVRTRTVLASKDPVALDYHAAKYIVYPNSRVPVHNPDDQDSPMYQYLKECAQLGAGVLDERKVAVISYDFKRKYLQGNDELVVSGEKEWGKNPKTIMKYLLTRYGNWLL